MVGLIISHCYRVRSIVGGCLICVRGGDIDGNG